MKKITLLLCFGIIFLAPTLALASSEEDGSDPDLERECREIEAEAHAIRNACLHPGSECKEIVTAINGVCLHLDESSSETTQIITAMCESLYEELQRCLDKIDYNSAFGIRKLWERYYPKCGKCNRSIDGVNVYDACADPIPDETPDYRPGCEKGWTEPEPEPEPNPLPIPTYPVEPMPLPPLVEPINR